MRKTSREIISDVESHLACSKKKYYSDFYIGITNNVDRRLFGEHNVDREHSWWIYRTAIDKAAAQVVELEKKKLADCISKLESLQEQLKMF
mgnify:CR=1 FL=1